MHKQLLTILLFIFPLHAFAGQAPRFTVLPGISHGRLTIFPVIANSTNDTSQFITLDEGLRSGTVTVTEGGRAQRGLLRGPRASRALPVSDDVNRLVLVNDSDRPLLLLAGEIVVGGKQDRVVAKDRIVPAHGDSVDLSVFCVEPGRWTEKSASFGGLASQMAQPSVRKEAMAAKDQHRVWDAVGAANTVTVEAATGPISSGGPAPLRDTSSYAVVATNKVVQEKVQEIAGPIERSYEKVIQELGSKNAVGVAVAVDGRVVWADIFASPQLLRSYWPKLIRSYAAETFAAGSKAASADQSAAQAFVNEMEGRHEIVENEPAVFRHVEADADTYRVFTLTSLLPKTGYIVHIAKMAEDTGDVARVRR